MKHALVTYGGWEGHEPAETAGIAAGLLRAEGYEIRVETSLDCYLDGDALKELDLIIHNWTQSEITKEQEQGLLDCVRGGVGIAGWHGGLGDSFRTRPAFQWMVGGQWVAHPGNIITYSVHISKPGDSVVEGLSDFTMHSEQYYLHTDPTNEVLATTTFSSEHAAWIGGTVMPVAWKRRYGAGRVFYSALGHVSGDFEVPQVREILRRGMLWASR